MAKVKSIAIVPGYGFGVAQVQDILSDIVNLLHNHGKQIYICVNSNAGRFPDYIFNLLDDTNMPKNLIIELTPSGHNKKSGQYFDFGKLDLVIAVGANDIINCSVVDPKSPLFNQNQNSKSVSNVWEAKKCVVYKNSLANGYLNIDNPTFCKNNVFFIFGNIKNNFMELNNLISKEKIEMMDLNDSSHIDIISRSIDSELELVN